MGITEATTLPSNISGICGVAMEDITASAWGHVCMGGKCDVRVGISAVIAAGDPLYVTAGGAFIENTTYGTATAVHAVALEAVTTSAICSAALCSAFVNPGIHGMDPTMNYATA
jgi:hypothetical protein